MDRTATFVDAGYLFAAGSMLLAGEKLPRSSLHLDSAAVISSLTTLTQRLSGLPLLRIYWYDGTSTGPTLAQNALAFQPNVKLRLGVVNSQGEQKGVDSLIVTDMISLARNRAMTDAVLVTGDEDLRVGVQQAQEFGVRVHLVGVAPTRSNQSTFLRQEADTTLELAPAEIDVFLSRVAETPRSVVRGSVMPVVQIEELAQAIAAEMTEEEVDAVLRGAKGGLIPADVDRRLLKGATEIRQGSQLGSPEKRALREAFLAACRARR